MGKPGVLQSMGWQRVGHDLATEQQQVPCISGIMEYSSFVTDLFHLA